MPEQSPSHEEQKKRGKRLIVLSLAAMLIAAGVLGTMFYRSRQLATQIDEEVQSQHPRLTKPQQDAHLAKATLLRDKWRVWALQHKEVLQRCLSAQPNDRAAMMAVWNALPEDVDTVKGSITSDDLIPTKDMGAAIEARTPMFTWQPFDKESFTKVPYLSQRAQSNFAAVRDIEISTSMNVGTSKISLWASGRVTQETQVNKTTLKTEKGQSFEQVDLVPGPRKEIFPPYDFLKPQTKD